MSVPARHLRLLFVLTLVLGMMACDRVTGISGKVQDQQGAPLDGVTITLETDGRGPHKTTSSPDGSFSVTMVGADPSATKVSFQKEGYKPANQGLKEPRASGVVIVLEREAPR